LFALRSTTRRDQVSVVAKRHGISEQAIYTWRKRFGGFQANDVRRLKQLEAENARLKKLVAERDLVPWSPTVVVVRCGSK
jgi:putative transposase